MAGGSVGAGKPVGGSVGSGAVGFVGIVTSVPDVVGCLDAESEGVGMVDPGSCKSNSHPDNAVMSIVPTSKKITSFCFTIVPPRILR